MYQYVYCSEQTAETNFLSYREILSKFKLLDIIALNLVTSSPFALKINMGHQDCIELSRD